MCFLTKLSEWLTIKKILHANSHAHTHYLCCYFIISQITLDISRLNFESKILNLTREDTRWSFVHTRREKCSTDITAVLCAMMWYVDPRYIENLLHFSEFHFSTIESLQTQAAKCWWHMLYKFLLTHWGRVTHICVGKLTIIASDNGLSHGRRQAIIWTNAVILLIGPLGTKIQ